MKKLLILRTKPLEKFRRKLDSQRESDRSLADENKVNKKFIHDEQFFIVKK
mgnify:CR=1 FL=1